MLPGSKRTPGYLRPLPCALHAGTGRDILRLGVVLMIRAVISLTFFAGLHAVCECISPRPRVHVHREGPRI
jgi:hypothetical protein